MLINKEQIKELSNYISEAEAKTSGEIRIIIRRKKPLFADIKKINVIAETEFIKLKMQNTKNRNGILLYICELEKEFRIVADSGIDSKVDKSFWNELSKNISLKFKEAKYIEGLKELVNEVGIVLSKYFPPEENNLNEHSNEVIIR
ncbi:MAG: TPM domain-containing protein [Bacteroidetes bacterium]|nr:TPM domain-containing protein [Bacteroidota bacterium]